MNMNTDFSSVNEVVEAVINRFDINTIPPITDPKGSSWNQPKVEDIAICDEFAVMSLKDFNMLKDYSCSQPSGVYHGKMWKTCPEQFGNKKGIEYYKKHGKLPEDETLWPWKLVWFAYDRKGDTKYLSNNYRKIVIR